MHVDLANSILKLQPLTSCSSFTLHGLLSSKLCVDVPSPGGHPFASFGIVFNRGKDSMQVNAACDKPFNFSSSCVLFKILDLPPAVLGVGSCKDAGTYILYHVNHPSRMWIGRWLNNLWWLSFKIIQLQTSFVQSTARDPLQIP